MTVSGQGSKPVQDKLYSFGNFEDQANLNLSTRTAFGQTWSLTQNAEYKTTNCFEGTGCFGEIPGWESDRKVTGEVILPDVGYGGKTARWFYWKSDAVEYSTDNWKTWRYWAAGLNYPNTYTATQTDNGFMCYTENGASPVNGVDRFYFSPKVLPSSSAWKFVEILTQLNTGAGNQDGKIIISIDGQVVLDGDTWRSSTTTFPNRQTDDFIVHMVQTAGGGGSPPPRAGKYVRYDYLGSDTSWCQVFAAASPTLAGVTQKFPLCIVSWGSQIQVQWTVKKPNGTLMYLYVRDNNNTTNATGYPITVNGTSSGAPAPTVSTVTPTNGTHNGGTSIQIDGADFVATPGVTVGGNTCTSVSFVNSTRLTCTTPAGTSNLNASVVVTNPDGQTGTKTNAFLYNPDPAPTATNVSPNHGPAAGGTSVTITGTNFTGTPTVKLNAFSCTSVVRVNSTTITCVTPPGIASTVATLTVTNPDGQIATLLSAFTYDAGSPTTTGVFPWGHP